MRAAGITGCLVTGRMYRATLPFARELHLDAPLICYQGAAIIDPASDEVLEHSALSNEVVRELYASYGPRLIAGPDLYEVLSRGRDAMFDQAADLHPNKRGNAAIRQAWADAMIARVYR